jgi:hypothetical protein
VTITQAALLLGGRCPRFMLGVDGGVRWWPCPCAKGHGGDDDDGRGAVRACVGEPQPSAPCPSSDRSPWPELSGYAVTILRCTTVPLLLWALIGSGRWAEGGAAPPPATRR